MSSRTRALPAVPRCESCGQPLPNPYISHLSLIEQEILQAVAACERFSGRAATQAVAMRVHLSTSQTRRHLHRLAEAGFVHRSSHRSGWNTIRHHKRPNPSPSP